MDYVVCTNTSGQLLVNYLNIFNLTRPVDLLRVLSKTLCDRQRVRPLPFHIMVYLHSVNFPTDNNSMEIL